MKNRYEVEGKIRNLLGTVTPYESLSILNDMSKEILRSVGESGPLAGIPVYPRILNRKGSKSIIDKDPEMKKYILGLTETTTIAALRNKLISLFGKERVPSKSALHRYLAKLEGRA
ncbi:hypothetical protein HTZ97_09335 [Desulfuromonas acetoxidans]|uniref:hypothetical protein n=1 Tax=Desulfuromonas acetoxidans TaxID=891 RepID=UPI00058B9D72|nr:hypothetical protein [Desulfuromonas acetoxidans]MBF0646400.1 hypothetical protein [Desulfuromonas acetoxidans]NVD24385.1 hypothetical protein [Desulfuromonas acetoxidans]NVE16667.1 hypothetical protein [Desulfuromonas acetoxidans]